jgi:hypothetical protein
MPGMEDFKDDLELELELKREEIHQEKGLWLCLIFFKAICPETKNRPSAD